MSDFTYVLGRHTGRSQRTIRRWLAAGRYPGAYRTKGGHWRLCNTYQAWLRFLERNSELVKQCAKHAQHGQRRLKQVMQASMALRGLTESDLDDSYESLKQRKPHLAELWYDRPVRDFIHPRAVEALKRPNGLLLIHAERLLADHAPITPRSLAASLGCVVSTLYDRYEKQAIRQACSLGKSHPPGFKLEPKNKPTSTVHIQKDAPAWLAKHSRKLRRAA